jgi:hypothetical protein
MKRAVVKLEPLTFFTARDRLLFLKKLLQIDCVVGQKIQGPEQKIVFDANRVTAADLDRLLYLFLRHKVALTVLLKLKMPVTKSWFENKQLVFYHHDLKLAKGSEISKVFCNQPRLFFNSDMSNLFDWLRQIPFVKLFYIDLGHFIFELDMNGVVPNDLLNFAVLCRRYHFDPYHFFYHFSRDQWDWFDS